MFPVAVLAICQSPLHVQKEKTFVVFVPAFLGDLGNCALFVFGYLGSTLLYSSYIGLGLGMLLVVATLVIVGRDPDRTAPLDADGESASPSLP